MQPVSFSIFIWGRANGEWSLRKNAFYPGEGTAISYTFGNGKNIAVSYNMSPKVDENFYVMCGAAVWGGFLVFKK